MIQRSKWQKGSKDASEGLYFERRDTPSDMEGREVRAMKWTEMEKRDWVCDLNLLQVRVRNNVCYIGEQKRG